MTLSLSTAQADVSVQEADFDLGLEVAALRAGDLGVGAVASFVGTVRQWVPAGAVPYETLADEAATGGQTDGANVADVAHMADMADAAAGRRDADGTVASPGPVLVLEHYPGMTERRIEAMVAEARRRFDVRRIRVIHRFGPLSLGDQIVLVAVSSAHRREAFQCCEFLMDWLKTDAPFWKQERSAHGERWVEARVQDDEALARWQPGAGDAKEGVR